MKLVIHIRYISTQCVIYRNDTLYVYLFLTTQFLFALSPCPSTLRAVLARAVPVSQLFAWELSRASLLPLLARAPYAEHAVWEGFP